VSQPFDLSAAAVPRPARALTPDADPSAEMEMLRLRRVRRAFAGPAVDDVGASPLTRGLVAGAALGLLAVLAMGVAGVIQATWTARELEERQRNQPATTVAPATTATTRPAPSTPTTRSAVSTTVPSTRRGPLTTVTA
jgi:hypothetical protein